jgi:riboflavin synthase
MFTGIITDIGKVKSLVKSGDLRIDISTNFDLSSVAIGASIACSGVCLTVVKKGEGQFSIDVSGETVSCSTLGVWQVGTSVNLERSLRLGDELGGHIVSGHVDGLAEVLSVKQIGNSHEMVFVAPEDLKFFIAAKGSVVLDGVSLTVNYVDDNKFGINIIPHTWENTTFNELKVGSKVNLEIDTMARYVARLVGFAGVKGIESNAMINLPILDL